MNETFFQTALVSSVFGALVVVFQVIILTIIVARVRSPHAVRLAWILVVVSLPIVGGLLFLRLGRVRERALVSRHRALIQRVRKLTEAERRPLGDELEIHDLELRKGARLIQELGGSRPSGGNRVRLFGAARVDDDRSVGQDCMLEDIDSAESSCHLLFYIYLCDETGERVGAALQRAAERGVVCRLLVDAIGSHRFLRSKLRRELERSGVRVATAMAVHPLRALFNRFDHRNHRKIAVIDGRVAWAGSQNIANPSFAPKARYAPWVDIMVRIEGPAVHDLQSIFVEDWLLDHGGRVEELLTPRPAPFPDGVAVQILPSGPSAETEAMKEVTLLGFLESDDEIILTTPYFVPDDATVTALRSIARSGVRTVLVVPENNDSRLVGAASRSYYETLLDAGVEIYEYQPGLLHAKTFTFDRVLSAVATANLDRRSYELNYEVSVVVADPAFTRQLRELQLGYLEHSKRIDPEEWRRRGAVRRFVQNAAGLVAPLL